MSNTQKGFFRIHGCPQRIEFASALIEFYLDSGIQVTVNLKGKILKKDLQKLKPALKFSIKNLADRYRFRFTFDFYHSSKLVICRYLPYDCQLESDNRVLADLRLLDYNPRVFYASKAEKQSITQLFHNLIYNRIINSYSDSNSSE
jgi:hypothetical protein